MIDIKEIERKAREELNEELSKSATAKIKQKLREIAMAERALVNMRQEYQVMLRDIGGEEEAAG